jgi:hypothetical protein
LWGQPFLRTSTFRYGLTNFTGPSLLLAIVVIGERQRLPGWAIGALLAGFSACVLAGSLVCGSARRVLPDRLAMPLELWAWPGPLAFLIWPNMCVQVVSILPVGNGDSGDRLGCDRLPPCRNARPAGGPG